jgi:hypothetical protein
MLDYVNVPTGVGATASITWRSQPGVHNTNRAFELPLTLEAAGTVSFYVKVSSEGSYDGVRFYIDDVQQNFWSGEGNFGLVSFAVASGAHTFKWAYTKDGSAEAGWDTAWIALLTVTNVAPASMPPVKTSPLDPAVYDFEDGTIPPLITTTSWINSTSSPISGSRSLRTPLSTADSATYTATIAVPELPENGVVSADFKVDAESGDRLWFTLDNVDHPFFMSTGGPKKIAFVIPQMAGTHTLRVEYRKDSTLSSGEDAAWIDNLHIPFQVGGEEEPPPWTPTVLLEDNFNRANHATVIGAPQIGPSPVVQTGVGGITSNQLYGPTPPLNVTYDLGRPDVEISFLAALINTGLYDSVLLGYVSSTDYYTVAFGGGGNSPVQLNRWTVGGSYTLCQSSVKFPANNTSICRAHHRDGIIRAYVDDVLVIRWRLDSPITSNLHGVRLNTNSVRLDNLLGTDAPVIDDDKPNGERIDLAANFLATDPFAEPMSLYKGRDTKTQDVAAGA